jgi:hypothetical protein
MLRGRNYFDAGTVARYLKQRETKGILLSAEYSAYQSLLVSRDPIASAGLAHFEVVRGDHCRGRKAGHVRSANLLFLLLYASGQYNRQTIIRLRDVFNRPCINFP